MLLKIFEENESGERDSQNLQLKFSLTQITL